MRSPMRFCVVLLGVLLPAQNPTAPDGFDAPATAKRLQEVLRRTAGIRDTAFVAQWRPMAPGGGAVGMPSVLVERLSGKVSGSWHEGSALCTFDNGEQDELLQHGRHTLARSRGGAWRVRRNSFADGNHFEFLPDPELLVRLLANLELVPTHRSFGRLDDREVEIVSTTLTREQIGELLFAGAHPRPFSATRQVAVGPGGRAPATVPDAVLDFAIAFDPATKLVLRIRSMCYSKASGGAAVLVGGVAARPVAPPRANEPEPKAEPQPEPAEGAPLEYTDGLPVRAAEGKQVLEFDLRLRDHGKATAPTLDAAQLRLLGR